MHFYYLMVKKKSCTTEDGGFKLESTQIPKISQVGLHKLLVQLVMHSVIFHTSEEPCQEPEKRRNEAGFTPFQEAKEDQPEQEPRSQLNPNPNKDQKDTGHLDLEVGDVTPP